MHQRFNADPDLPDVLELHRLETLLSLNCHAIGIIQEFDATKQVVKATIAYKKTFVGEDGQDTYQDYPVLVDVPVIIMSGGLASLTMPIAKGDECLILFNDRDIDNWFEGGGVTKLATDRLHNFSDGFALIGVRSKARSLAGYDSSRAVLRNDKAKVAVGPAKVSIANDTKNLFTILSTLLDALASAQTTNAVSGAPSSLSPTTISAINQAKADLGGLLE